MTNGFTITVENNNVRNLFFICVVDRHEGGITNMRTHYKQFNGYLHGHLKDIAETFFWA